MQKTAALARACTPGLGDAGGMTFTWLHGEFQGLMIGNE